jgi:hypothetical protein
MEEHNDFIPQIGGSSVSLQQVIVATEGQSLDIVHPCTDYGFKRAFQDKQTALGFLNKILGFSGRDAFTKISFLDKEFPSREHLGRDFIVDILCETELGHRFLIEMQNDFYGYYAAKAITEFCRFIAHWDAEVIHQKATEESRKRARTNTTYDGVKKIWKDIKTTIVLVITNKRFPPEQRKTFFSDHTVMEPDIINTYRMMHESVPGRPLCDLDARVVLVMLGNFNKTETELVTPLDQWLYAFKDEALADGVSRIPAYKHINDIRRVGVQNDPGLASFYTRMNKDVVHMAGELESFEKNIAEVNRVLEVMEERKRLEGRAEGRLEGRAEGRLEGQAERKHEMAVDMLKEGEPDSKILKYAKITVVELQAIKISMES